MIGTIKDEGSLNARILLVGGAPGKSSLAWNRPFGHYINDLKNWWKEAGIDEIDVYRTYVYKDIPPVAKFDLDLGVKTNRVARKDIDTGWHAVRALADRMPNLEVIVPVDDYALAAFTKFGKTVMTPTQNGLHDIRGSVYTWEGMQGGKSIKVVGTYAPHMAVMVQNVFAIRHDWARIAYLRDSGPFEAPNRTHVIHPTLNDCRNYFDSITSDTILSIDIETWGGELKCIGFCMDDQTSFTIPTMSDRIGSVPFGPGNEWWEIIRGICEAPCDTLAQNGLFDAWWLARGYGIEMTRYWWDTLAMHHALQPMDKHSLQYMTSVYTWQPYYKDEAKAADEIVKVAKKNGMDKLYVYNGLDCLVTYEVFVKLYDQLEEKDMLGFYFKHYADMNAPLLSMMMGGVPVNIDTINAERKRLKEEAVYHRDKASVIAKQPLWNFKTTACERDMLATYLTMSGDEIRIKAELLNMGHKQVTIDKKWGDMQNKGVSDMMLNEVLYGAELCAPSGKVNKGGAPKADNIALKTLLNVVKDRKRKPPVYEGEFETWRDDITSLIDEVLSSRRAAKLSTFVDPKKVDPDGRLRCTYKYTTKSGRLASSANPGRTGMNLQNIDREMRHPFEATDGRVLVEYDLSQAEGRYVKIFTGCPTMTALAHRLPTEGDEHTENAMGIFDVAFEVAKEKKFRNIGKKTVHATNYGMRGNTFSDQLLKEGYTYTPKECQALIDKYADMYPALREWHSTVRRTMLRRQKLFTSWGRVVDLKGLPLDDDMFKFGYSWVPQSEIGDLLNQYGLKPLYHFLRKNNMKSEIVLQVHDSVVLNAVIEELYDISCFLFERLNAPRTIGQVFGVEETIRMPVEMGIGKTWAKAKEWKFLPDESDLTDSAKELLLL